jgi:hypothetical protein
MPNANSPPTLVTPQSKVTEAFDDTVLAIRLESDTSGGFVSGDTIILSGCTLHNGTYTVQSILSDAGGDYITTTTTFPGGLTGTGGKLSGTQRALLKLRPDTESNIDIVEDTTDANTFLIQARSGGGGGGSTLDGAYDFGGAGSGRSITADSGAVEIGGVGVAPAFLVSHGSDVNTATISGDASAKTVPTLVVTASNHNTDDIPALQVLTGRAGTATRKFEVRETGAFVTGETATPQLQVESSNVAVNAQISLKSNSNTSSIISSTAGALTITGADTAALSGTTSATVGASDGDLSLTAAKTASPTANVVVTADGFSVGAAPTTLNNNSAAIGGPHTSSIERSLVVGQSNTASDDSLAVGENCLATVNSLAVGNGANTSSYTGGSVICLAANNDLPGSFSTNTLVMDAGNNPAAGPPPATAIAPGIPPSGGVGNVYSDAGTFYSGNADYAEMFEWDDGNTNSVDRRGFFVSLVNGNKIEIGNTDVIGVVSARPVVLGDASELSWQGKYDTDEFGALQYDLVDGVRVPRLNANYNPTQTYTPRRARKEWSAVGLVGKLYVRSAQALNAGSRCSANSSGYAVSGNDYRILRIIRQATSTNYGIIEILMK